MPDSRYCYPGSDVLINKLNIEDGDLNALHPFREGNGRAQREFARLVCLECGYDFDLSCTTHYEMLEASQLSFGKGDSAGFIKIFSQAVTPIDEAPIRSDDHLGILTSDDLTVGNEDAYDYYGYGEYKEAETYDKIYEAKINKMDAEKTMSETRMQMCKKARKYKEKQRFTKD